MVTTLLAVVLLLAGGAHASNQASSNQASSRLVVTFESVSDNVLDGVDLNDLGGVRVVKQYGRRLVLDLGAPFDLEVERGHFEGMFKSVQSVETDYLVSARQELMVSDALLVTNATDTSDTNASDPDVSGAYVDPATQTPLWNLMDDEPYSIRAEGVWKITNSTPDIVVAVIDTGIAEPARSMFLNLLDGYDFISDDGISIDWDGRDPDATDPGDWGDMCPIPSWHGTKVASILAARHDNEFGMKGVAQNCSILPVRVLGLCRMGYATDVSDAIVWSAGGTINGVPDNPTPAKIISLSLAGQGACPGYLQSAVNQAVSLGSIVIAAAGNNNQNVSGYFPANCIGVIAVAASTREGGLAGYSNWGELIKVSAPGGDSANAIMTLSVDELETGLEVSYGMGTSFSTPQVAGVVVLINPGENKSIIAIFDSYLLQISASSSNINSVCNVRGCGGVIINTTELMVGAVSCLNNLGQYSFCAALDDGPDLRCYESCSCPAGSYWSVYANYELYGYYQGCITCPSGTYSNGGSNACSACASGTYSNPSSSVCKPPLTCAAGKRPNPTYDVISSEYTANCPLGSYVCGLNQQNIFAYYFYCCALGGAQVGYWVVSSGNFEGGKRTLYTSTSTGYPSSPFFLKLTYNTLQYGISRIIWTSGSAVVYGNGVVQYSIGGAFGDTYDSSCVDVKVATGFYGWTGSNIDQASVMCNSLCSDCPAGSYSATGAATCTACTSLTCPGSQYRINCGGASSGSCTPCAECGSGKYWSLACSGTNAGVCSPCTANNFCTGGTNAPKAWTLTCPAGGYLNPAPTPSADGVCNACISPAFRRTPTEFAWSPERWTSKNAWIHGTNPSHTPTNCIYYGKYNSQPAYICDGPYYAWSWEIYWMGSSYSDHVGTNIYRQVGPSSSVVLAGFAVMNILLPTINILGYCTSCEVCAAGTRRTSPCTTTANTVCEPCTANNFCTGGTTAPMTWTLTCPAGSYLNPTPTPSANGVCGACTGTSFRRTPAEFAWSPEKWTSNLAWTFSGNPSRTPTNCTYHGTFNSQPAYVCELTASPWNYYVWFLNQNWRGSTNSAHIGTSTFEQNGPTSSTVVTGFASMSVLLPTINIIGHCTLCGSCATDNFIATPCTTTTNTVCAACKVCDPGTSRITPCAPAANTVCTSSCTPGHYCLGGTSLPTICSPNPPCVAPEYIKSCTNTSNAVCGDCSNQIKPPYSYWMDNIVDKCEWACNNVQPFYFKDGTTCKACKTPANCTTLGQYTTICTTTTDGTCTNCTNKPLNSYYTSASSNYGQNTCEWNCNAGYGKGALNCTLCSSTQYTPTLGTCTSCPICTDIGKYRNGCSGTSPGSCDACDRTT